MDMTLTFFHAVLMSVLPHGCTSWILKKRLKKKLSRNHTRIIQAISNKFWKQHPTKKLLYGHLPPISQTIQERWAKHARHYWRSKDELIWTPTYGHITLDEPEKNLHSLALCRHWIPSRELTKSDSRWGQMSSESWRNPAHLDNDDYYIYIYIYWMSALVILSNKLSLHPYLSL